MEERTMRCEQVRALLPEYAGEPEPYPRPVQAHLTVCSGCALEESRYRGLLEVVADLRDEDAPVPAGFSARVAEMLARPELAWRGRVRRLRHDRRTRYAAAGLGGAVVGAAAIALILRRGTRRGGMLPAA
jgi:hypothetical protein